METQAAIPQFVQRARENYVYPRLDVNEDRLEAAEPFMRFVDAPASAHPGTVLYVHLPFCTTLCGFCPYFKVRSSGVDDADKARFYAAMVREIELYGSSPFFAGRRLSVVQFGGGTPMVTEVPYFEAIFSAIRSAFDLSEVESITVEATVESLLDLEKLRALRQLGVNRVSFGTQTFKPQLRRKLGLRARERDVFSAVELLHDAGIDHFATDLMYNLPDQTVEDLEQDVERFFDLGATSVDVYPLTVYANTHFEHIVESDRIFSLRPEQARELEMYDLLRDRLPAAGYSQVKSFTFSRETPAWIGSRLFLQNGHVLGIGPSAKSFVAGWNYRNVPDLQGYTESLEAGRFAVDCGNYAEPEVCSERAMVFSPVLLGVRKDMVDHYSLFEPKVRLLEEAGYVTDRGDRIELTREGGKWTGNISRFFYSTVQAGKSTRSYLYCLREHKHPYNQDETGIRHKGA